MIGAIIGDIVGSRFEFNNHRSKVFELFIPDCFATDDSIMTLAVAKALLETDQACAPLSPGRRLEADYLKLLGENTVHFMREIGQKYPSCGFGGRFARWMFSDQPQPYHSFGNGSAMRISPVGFLAQTEAEVAALSRTVTAVTHDHSEGIKGAEATALAIFLARQGFSKSEIRQRITRDYYPINFTIDQIRPTYQFNETCQETVPQAIACFLESESFEDAIRLAISLGGESGKLVEIILCNQETVRKLRNFHTTHEKLERQMVNQMRWRIAMNHVKQAWINFIFFAVTLAVNTLGAIGLINGLSQKEISDRYLTLITPSPATFSIWSVIYTFLLIAMIVMISRQKDPYYQRAVEQISNLFRISCVLNAAWIVAFSFVLVEISVLFILGFVIALALISQKLLAFHERKRWLLPVTFGLYGGWLFVATVVNTAAALVKLNWSRFGLSEEAWGIIMLLVAILLLIVVVLKLRNAVFPLPIAWAYWGIYQFLKSPAGFGGEYPALQTVSLIGLVVLLVISVTLFVKNRLAVLPE